MQAGAIEAFVEKWEKFCGFRWDKRYRYRKQPSHYLWVQLDDGIEGERGVRCACGCAGLKAARDSHQLGGGHGEESNCGGDTATTAIWRDTAAGRARAR